MRVIRNIVHGPDLEGIDGREARASETDYAPSAWTAVKHPLFQVPGFFL
jgi:hypothetical protein